MESVHGPLLRSLLVITSIAIGTFLVKLYNARMFFRRLQEQGLVSTPPIDYYCYNRTDLIFLGQPMPPHHPILGHIALSARILGGLPKNAHGHYLADQINRMYPDLGPSFYLDTWPFGPPVLVVISPDMMYQYTQDRYLQKHVGMRRFLEPLTGEHDLVSMEGPMWKRWRRIFNPGFSATHIATLCGSVMEEVKIFRDLLRKHAVEGDIFRLEDHALNVAIDVVGRAAMDVRFNSQTSYCDMTTALREQVPWCSFGIELSPFAFLNPIRPIARRWNTYRMNRWIVPRLEARYSSNRGTVSSKSVIDLALNTYHEEIAVNSDKGTTGMDTMFRAFATSQLKLFVFAGHDTTASTICYVYHNLWRSPSALARIREEHDSVFGRSIEAAEMMIQNDPHILNALPFTIAVIKETLRLFPVVTTTRQGIPDFILTDSEGRQFPTDKCLVWGNHHGLHRNPRYWPKPDQFLPERWLVAERHPLYPVKNAWRPFEFGPRTCIGQELAMMEMKMILVMTIRELNVEGAFSEWDQLHPRKGIKEVRGERAYQMILGSAHPADGYPCKVSLTR